MVLKLKTIFSHKESNDNPVQFNHQRRAEIG